MSLQMLALRYSLKIIANPLLTRHFKFDHVIYTMTIIHYVSLKIPAGAPASARTEPGVRWLFWECRGWSYHPHLFWLRQIFPLLVSSHYLLLFLQGLFINSLSQMTSLDRLGEGPLQAPGLHMGLQVLCTIKVSWKCQLLNWHNKLLWPVNTCCFHR